MSQLFFNNFTSSITDNPLTIGATTINLHAGDGARLPAIVNAGDYYYLTLSSGSPESAWEIVKVTARATDALTVVRGQDGTAAASWTTGTAISGRLSAVTMKAAVLAATPLLAAHPSGPSATDLAAYPLRWSRQELFVQDDDAIPRAIATSFAYRNVVMILAAQATGTSLITDGSSAGVGPASTDYVASQPGNQYTSAVAANSPAGLRSSSSDMRWWRGNAAGLGGFFAHCRVTIGALASDQRAFIGLTTNTGALATDPSAAGGNFIGIAADAADVNLQIMSRDGTTVNKIDLGVKKDTVNKPNQMLDIYMYCASNSSTIYVTVDSWSASTKTNLVTNQAVTTNIPSATSFMKLCADLCSTATDTVAVVLRHVRSVLESN
jgi:hypothetical protein